MIGMLCTIYVDSTGDVSCGNDTISVQLLPSSDSHNDQPDVVCEAFASAILGMHDDPLSCSDHGLAGELMSVERAQHNSNIKSVALSHSIVSRKTKIVSVISRLPGLLGFTGSELLS